MPSMLHIFTLLNIKVDQPVTIPQQTRDSQERCTYPPRCTFMASPSTYVGSKSHYNTKSRLEDGLVNLCYWDCTALEALNHIHTNACTVFCLIIEELMNSYCLCVSTFFMLSHRISFTMWSEIVICNFSGKLQSRMYTYE